MLQEKPGRLASTKHMYLQIKLNLLFYVFNLADCRYI
jgi:hypothetical protein